MILWKYNDGVPQVSGDGTFGTYWLRHLGVEDPAAEASGFSQVSMEQIYSWDPEILFVDGPGLISIRSGDVLNNTVEGADFSSIKAVKDKRVYGTTLGMWNWFTPNRMHRWYWPGLPAEHTPKNLRTTLWRIPSETIISSGTAMM